CALSLCVPCSSLFPYTTLFRSLRASGFLDFLSETLGRMTELVHFPSELVPLTIVRMFSASAATGLALDIFKEYGTDSYLGLTARSEEHTSELQSRFDIVCRLLL